MEAGTIAAWKVAEGSGFAAGDVIAEIETDKATVDFEAQDDGVLAKILVEASTEVQVGQPIMVVVEDQADVAAFESFAPDAAAAPPPMATTAAAPPAAPAAPAAAPPQSSTPQSPAAPVATAPGERTVASPLARKLASEQGYDLSLIAGTGPGGRVVAADVLTYTPAAPAMESAVPTAETAGLASTAPAFANADYADYPLSPQSAAIAARLAYSMQAAPHYYLTIELDMTESLKLLDQLNANVHAEEAIAANDILIKALAGATKAVPAVNASWIEPGTLRQYTRLDVNVVMGADEGLQAPVLVDVQRMGLKDIADATKAFALPSEDPATYARGTFTVMNLGAFGVAAAAPIVHTPQACALAFGAIEDKLVPGSAEDPYLVRPSLKATLSADHRVVDGAVGAQWLSAFKGLVETPHTLLL